MKSHSYQQTYITRATAVFITFLYAAAVNVLLAQATESQPATLIPIGMVVFILFDWISRVTVPPSLPVVKLTRSMYHTLKSVLEVLGVAFLTISFAGLANTEQLTTAGPFQLTPIRSFALFAATTFAWNGLMLWATNDISWCDIFKKSFFGKVFESESAQNYTENFFDSVSDVHSNIDNAISQAQGREDLKKASTDALRYCTMHGLERTVAQFVGIHVSWANLAAGLALLGGSYQIDITSLHGFYKDLTHIIEINIYPYLSILSIILLSAVLLSSLIPLFLIIARFKFLSTISISIIPVAILIAACKIYSIVEPILWIITGIILVPLLIFNLGVFFDKEFLFVIAGFFMFVSLITSYLYISPHKLTVFIAIQQVLMTIFISHATDGNHTRLLPSSASK